MKRFLIILMLLPLFASHSSCKADKPEVKKTQPVTPAVPGEQSATGPKVSYGDPFIMLYNGTYYAYGTANANGFKVLMSDDMKTWRKPMNDKFVLHKDDVWADDKFWAPEVYFVNGKFYMYFSGGTRICVATADSPLGPFKQTELKPMLEEQSIDNSLFIDTDGKAYLYFDRFNDGLNIWVAELDSSLTEILPETLTKCIAVSQDWEKVWPRVNEGAFVVKHNGVYYMTYSANGSARPTYGIGVATATSPKGPWKKYEGNPIYQFVGGLEGIGHSAMFTGKDGKMHIVFHAHQAKGTIHPRVMYISTVDFKTENGVTRMVISPNYVTPVLAQ